MKSIMIIGLLAATAIAAPTDLEFPDPNYFGGHEISVVDADVSKMWMPPEMKEVMNKDKPSAKDVYNDLYVYMGPAKEDEVPAIRNELFKAMFYAPKAIAPNGYRLYRIGTRNVGGYKRYLYSDEHYNLYAKV